MVVPDKKTKAQIQDDRLNGHWDKIEALEKNIKSMVETDTSNQDRIISLEKKLEDLEDMQKTIVKTDPVRMNKEIAELRELLHGHHLELDKIAELKEHTSDLQRQANHNAIETNTREVILTEVLQIIIDDFYIGISWEGGKKELLEKLDPPKGEVDIANMVLKRCPYCTELFSVDANTLEIRGSLKEDRLSGGTDDKTEKKEDSDAKQVEKLLNNMGCDVKVASVEWSENLIKGSREKKMTDDEIMLFNEELMAKIHKREVQPLEVSGGSKSLSTPQTSVERRVMGEGKEASNDNEEKPPEPNMVDDNGIPYISRIDGGTIKPKEKPKTEPEKGDSYCVGALLDGIHDYWEVYDLTTDTGRLGFAEELMGVLKVFYFEDFKERVRKELIEEFLLDFQWYLAFITHFQWTKACSCKTNPIRFEKWMIKKWRGKLKQ